MMERKVFSGGEFLVSDVAPEQVFTPEEITKAHKMIYDATWDFIKKEIHPNIERLEEKEEAFARELFEKAGDLCLCGTDVPEQYGGEGMDKISTCMVTEAMGAAASFAVSHSAHTGIGTLPIVYFGNEEQKKKYLPRLASGEWVAAYCLTEPNAGSDALNAQTTATLTEDGKHYRINGEKIYITNGAWADLYIVYAKVDGEHFTGFIVERTFPGVTPGPEEKKLGIKGSSTTPVVFKDCQVPVENVLYEVGKGHKIAFNILNIGRYKLGASTVGSCKLTLSEAAKYAGSREQFGKKISSFGMVKNKLADMAVRTFMAEAMSYRLAAAIEDRLDTLPDEARGNGTEVARAIEEYAVECSICKVVGSETLDFCVDELVQIFGGNGYTAEYPAERFYRDARINRIFEGTNEINRLLIPGTVVKRAMAGRLPVLEALGALEKELAAGDIPPAPMADENPLAVQEHLVKMAKKASLMAAGAAVQKLLANLADEQETLGLLADMMIEIFVMESGLLRAKKLLDKKGEKKAALHIAAVKTYINDTIPKFAAWVRQVLVFVSENGNLPAKLAIVDRLFAHEPVETISLRREIADKVIRSKRYPF